MRLWPGRLRDVPRLLLNLLVRDQPLGARIMVDDVHCAVLVGVSRLSSTLLWFLNSGIILLLLPSGAVGRQDEEDEGQHTESKCNPSKSVRVVIFHGRVSVQKGLLMPGFSTVRVKIQLIFLQVFVPMEGDHSKKQRERADEASDARNDEGLQRDKRKATAVA